jgi:hypothetical protein
MKSRDLEKSGREKELSWWESGLRDRSSLVYAFAGMGAVKKLLSQREKKKRSHCFDENSSDLSLRCRAEL